MKETDRRRGSTPNNKGKSNPTRHDTRVHRQQQKSGGRNLKAREIDAKPSSEKLNDNTSVSGPKDGVEPSEVFDSVVKDYINAQADTKTIVMGEKHANENNSSDMEIDETETETSNDSVSSQGDVQAVDEEKMEDVGQASVKIAKNSSADGYSDSPKSKSDWKTNKSQNKAPRNTPEKGAKPEKGISNPIANCSSDNSKNMKVHPKPLSDSSEGADGPLLEQENGADILDEASSGTSSVCSNDEAISTHENDKNIDQAAVHQKIEEMENRIKDLESELREVAALEIALYSVVPEHSSSSHKVHTPARRLSRLYIYACKYWSQDKRATVARNIVSGLVLVSKSCGNDVSRLTFWLSNTVVLREIISLAFGIYSRSSTKSNGVEMKSSSHKWKNSRGSRQLNKQSLLMFADDWQETVTFISALEKIESWIFSRIVESIWWQTLTPNMQSHIGGTVANKGSQSSLSPALGNQDQVNFSINLWEIAFHDALKRLCPVQAGGHECGCLPVLPRKVMEQCIGRLDVAMFNAILRESVHEIPTDPVSDPIVNSKVLPIPAGDLSFGSGAQLKNSVGNWTRWLTEFFGMDADNSAKDENNIQDDDDKRGTEEPPKNFPLLNALSGLLMLPKDMLMDSAIRMEVCPTISLPLVKRVLCNFSPDEFCPDPVPGAVLEAINSECLADNYKSPGGPSSFPYTAAPIVYTAPSSSEISEKVAEVSASSQFKRSPSAVQRKGYTSDEELDELESSLACIVENLPLSPTAAVDKNGNDEVGYDTGNTRYDLLREVWQSSQS